MIPWRPIAELPDELKDGQQVAFAFSYENGTINPGPPHWLYSFGRWYESKWLFDDSDAYGQLTHFAEITPP